jgi:hypothetical protein
MGNTLIAYPDRTMEATTTFSGGSWNASFPLTNLQNALLSKVIESTNDDAASTQWVETFNAPKDVRVIALLNHNISLAGTIRVRGYSDAGLTALVYDTGTQYAWPQTFTAEQVLVWPNNWIWHVPTIATARYWKVEIVDTTNAAGKITIGRCWLGPVPLEPTIGIPEGAEIGYEPRSIVTESLGGILWANRKASKRSFVGLFPRLTEQEQWTALIMQKTIDISGELLFVRNKNDSATNMLLKAFPCTPRKVSPLRLAYLSASEMGVEFVENVA